MYSFKKMQLKSVYTNMLYESDAGGRPSHVWHHEEEPMKYSIFLKYSSIFDPFH